jgi:guanine nucleotide-binding protein G(i) subunit alpha
MRIIHNGGFPEDERLSYREVVFSNIIESIKAIVNAMKNKLGIEISSEDHREAFDLIAELPEQVECEHHLRSDIAQAIKILWQQDDGVKEAYRRRNEYQLNDSAA